MIKVSYDVHHPHVWTLLEDYSRDGITVPAGFTFDVASVPRFAWWLYPRWGRYAEAALVHDYLCTGDTCRKEADKLFYKHMREDGVLRVHAWIMYACVRSAISPLKGEEINMEAIVEVLKKVFPKRWHLVAAATIAVVVTVPYLWGTYQSEKAWHAWAQSKQVHHYSEVEYKDGKVRVKWESWPTVPSCDFRGEYIIHRPGYEAIIIPGWTSPFDLAKPYRVNTEDHHTKKPSVWGSWIDVSNYVNPGQTYELTMRYTYGSCYGWDWFSAWAIPKYWDADQKIIFRTEDNNEK